MGRASRSEWKAAYFKRLGRQLNDCEKCFIVGVDNVRSSQMAQIRHALRGTAEMVMGKNTMMKKVISEQLQRNPTLDKLIPHIKENVGFVFTKADLSAVRDILENNRVTAPAKAGTIAPCDVIVPAQTTTLGPEKTSFFQALNIPTKISKGMIEIINDLTIITKDAKIFDKGSTYDPAVLDITPEMILAKFSEGVTRLAAVSLAVGHTTAASVPHILTNAFKKIVSVSVATDYTFEGSEKVKEFLADPSKFIAAAPQAAAAPAAAAPKEAAKEESEEESDGDMGFGLFD